MPPEQESTVINYVAHKTAQKLHASDKLIRGFLGPVGNGKTVTCIQECLRLSFEQHPNRSKIRKSRGIIVRNTGPELRTTTLKTWKQWIPEELAPLTMAPVITANLKMDLPDGTKVDLEVFFLALDREKDLRKLLSLECSWIFLNEAREMMYATLLAARERIGRYPAAADGYAKSRNFSGYYNEDGTPNFCKRPAILMDTNPPDTDHWWYQLAEEGCLRQSKDKDLAKKDVEESFDFFHGPSALIKKPDGYEINPEAENIEYLPGGHKYYLNMLGGNTDEHISVMVLGNYGALFDGKPVYQSYNDSFHCPEKGVRAVEELEIGLGWDFGLSPACVIGQMTERGQLKVIAEIVTEHNNVRDFARDHVKPFLNKYFKDFDVLFSVGDPSGNARGEGEGKSAIGILNDEYDTDNPLNMGFITEPALTNDITKRIDAVNQFMLKIVEGGEPGYLLNNVCKTLRKGKQGAYCYKKYRSADGYKEKPDKDQYSHAADAEQYLALEYLKHFEEDIDYEYEYASVNHRTVNAAGY